MSDTTESLRRKIDSAGDLQSVVRSMKALAASNIGQYEKSVLALADYYRTVKLGLGACFRLNAYAAPIKAGKKTDKIVGAVVFGSDQGLVGRFNDVVADYAIKTLAARSGQAHVWPVGERVQARLVDAGLSMMQPFAVPNSVQGITPLVGKILVASEAHQHPNEINEIYIIHNRLTSGSVYEPVSQRLLPLDENWRRELAAHPWPTKYLPQVLASHDTILQALISEYLFISLFRGCAESLAAENASRLAAMQRADKNIGDLLETLNSAFHQLRQSSIDEELFDVISGFEELGNKR